MNKSLSFCEIELSFSFRTKLRKIRILANITPVRWKPFSQIPRGGEKESCSKDYHTPYLYLLSGDTCSFAFLCSEKRKN